MNCWSVRVTTVPDCKWNNNIFISFGFIYIIKYNLYIESIQGQGFCTLYSLDIYIYAYSKSLALVESWLFVTCDIVAISTILFEKEFKKKWKRTDGQWLYQLCKMLNDRFAYIFIWVFDASFPWFVLGSSTIRPRWKSTKSNQ